MRGCYQSTQTVCHTYVQLQSLFIYFFKTNLKGFALIKKYTVEGRCKFFFPLLKGPHAKKYCLVTKEQPLPSWHVDRTAGFILLFCNERPAEINVGQRRGDTLRRPSSSLQLAGSCPTWLQEVAALPFFHSEMVPLQCYANASPSMVY